MFLVNDRVFNTKSKRYGYVIEVRKNTCVIQYEDDKTPNVETVSNSHLRKV